MSDTYFRTEGLEGEELALTSYWGGDDKACLQITIGGEWVCLNEEQSRELIDKITENFEEVVRFGDLSEGDVFDIGSKRYVKISATDGVSFYEEDYYGNVIEAGTHVGIDQRCLVEKIL